MSRLEIDIRTNAQMLAGTRQASKSANNEYWEFPHFLPYTFCFVVNVVRTRKKEEEGLSGNRVDFEIRKKKYALA